MISAERFRKMANEPTSFRTLIAAFTDFFTVAVHTILYERAIYPQTSFLSARKYNFAVRQSRHPKVCEWINDAVSSLETELLKGAVDRVALVIYTRSNTPAERYVFDVSRFPAVPPADLDTPLERSSLSGEKVAGLPLIDLEEQFRATMSKVANCGSSLKSLPEGCTFTLAIELKSEGQAPIAHPQAWMPSEPRPTVHVSPRGSANAVPLRAVGAGDMVFESWIEQSAAV